MTGVKITTLAELMNCAQNRKCVSVPKCRMTRVPAAFVQCMMARIVHRYLEAGMYVYEPEIYREFKK